MEAFSENNIDHLLAFEQIFDTSTQLYGAYFVLVAAQSERGTTARALRHLGVNTENLAAAARDEVDRLNAASA